MMTPEQIAAMRADAEAGTPGPWDIGFRKDRTSYLSMGDYRKGRHCQGDVFFDGGLEHDKANARRIARVPDMEATIIAQSAEIARLNEMLTVQWEGIPPHEKDQPG